MRKRKICLIDSRSYHLLLALLCLILMLDIAGAAEHPNAIEASRPAPPIKPQILPKAFTSLQAPPGYCESTGGSTLYESISGVKVNLTSSDVAQIVVDVYIANPTGCTAGNPCPEYDNSPEYVNVWIDWNGNNIWEPTEKVLDQEGTGYLNINYQGSMTFIGQITAPPTAVPSTWSRANLGWGHDPGDPCEPSWEWGNVVDTPVKLTKVAVLQLDALQNNVEIKDIANPIWQKIFDNNGALVNVNPPQNDPVAAAMQTGVFSIKATLGAYPQQPGWTPRVKYTWSVKNEPAYSGSDEFEGWTGAFDVMIPQMINQYELDLSFTIYDDQGNIVNNNQSMTTKLYVIYGPPVGDVKPPKEKWLDKATSWASYAVGPISATLFMKDDIYSKSHWLYRDIGSGGADNWQALVEDTATAGNCWTFSQVWFNLSKVLGVTGASAGGESRSTGQFGKGFVTKTPAKSLDSITGNAHPQSGATDRWRFYMHQLGKYGVQYYDPTFGNTYFDKEGYIEWHQLEDFHSDGGAPPRQMANLTDGHKVYRVNSLPPWGDYEYHSPASAMLTANSGDASFTGDHTVAPVDADGDGRYEQLQVTLKVNLANANHYSVVGALQYNGQEITSRPTQHSSLPTGFVISGVTGVTTGDLLFSGEDIFHQGFDGEYTLHASLLSAEGYILDQISLPLGAYSHTQFGEAPAYLTALTEQSKDTNGDGRYDVLVAHAGVNALQTGKYGVAGVLYAGTVQIGSASVTQTLQQGSRQITLDFDGKPINKSGANGPYKLEIVLSDSAGSQIGYREMMTAAYLWNQFAEQKNLIGSNFSDYGVDQNGNGYYELLRFQTSATVEKAGTYTLRAWLKDAEGFDICISETRIDMTSGLNPVTIDMDGRLINAHQKNGPYLLGYIILSDQNLTLLDGLANAYRTQPYVSQDFESATPPLIALTGSITDNGQDTDSNELYNFLSVSIGVITADNGVAVAIARLTDASGKEIIDASGNIPVVANAPGYITLNFDGRYIFGNLVNGPYTVKDILVYHTGDPDQSVTLANYTTGAYAYTNFEKAGVIHGVVKDDKGQPIKSAQIVTTVDDDFTDQQGLYKLTFLQGGSYDIHITHGQPNAIWKLYANGQYVGEGASAAIPVTVGIASQLDFVLKGANIPGDLDGDGDVDKDDLNLLLAARNTPAAGSNDPRDLDGDGKITALDARKLALLCTHPGCATH